MKTAIMAAAFAAAVMAFGASAPAQARMANPALNAAAPAEPLVQDVQYRRDRDYRRYHSRSWQHRRHRYRHCSNQRVRVHIPGGRIVFRTHRRCGWRWR